MNPRENLSLLEVIENLNTIVEAESLDDIEVTDNHLFIPHSEIAVDEEESYWMPAGVNDETLSAIKVTFRSANAYLHSFYKKMQETGESKKLLDGIDTIMVLIGDARKKFEKFHRVFAKKIVELPEYKEIEDFYKKRVIKQQFKKETLFIPKFPEKEEDWEKEFEILVSEGEEAEEISGVHVLNDLDTIKKDHMYELFYLKNEAGLPFYTEELARKIKLGVDFGEFTPGKFREDPLTQIKNWQDKSMQGLAESLRHSCRREIENFYKHAFAHKEVELVEIAHKALMALMLASNPRNMIRQFSLKGCIGYFADFQLYLREALDNREYQKHLLYDTSYLQQQPFFSDVIKLLHALCFHLYMDGPDTSEIEKKLIDIIGESEAKSLPMVLENAYFSLSEVLKQHPLGPMLMALDLIREREERTFDPLMQGNLGEKEFTLQNDKEMTLLRMASPTKQEFVNVAEITEEFKAFLYDVVSSQQKTKLLLFNLQDRTSWREHARSSAIEEMSRNAFFSEVLNVCTLAKDTDFYNQMGIYHDLSTAKEFLSQFMEHLSDENTGYYFSPPLKNELFPNFIKDLLDTIHKAFFKGAKDLSLHMRLDFIELAYLLIELKIIEIVSPTLISHLSKDGLDVSSAMSVELTAMINIMQGKAIVETAYFYPLFGPTLIHRERILQPNRMERLVSVLKLIDKGDFKPIKALYNKETLRIFVRATT